MRRKKITTIEELGDIFITFKKNYETQIKNINEKLTSIEQSLNILTKKEMNNKILFEEKKEKSFLQDAITINENEKRIFIKDNYENNPYNDSLYEDTDNKFLEEENLSAEQISSFLNLKENSAGSIENFDAFENEENSSQKTTSSFPSYNEIARLEKERKSEKNEHISYDDILNNASENNNKLKENKSEETETYDLAAFLERNIIDDTEDKQEEHKPVKKKKGFFSKI